MQKRTTSRELAAALGVSPSTVSKALSGRGAVHPETRERIIRAAKEMGLRKGAADNHLSVGLITSEPFGRRTSPVLLGALEAFSEHDIAFIVCDGRGDRIREQHFLASLRRRHVDGVLVAAGESGSFGRAPVEDTDGLPTVYTMFASSDPGDVSVVPDHHGAARTAVEHLLSTGRTRIALVLGPAREDSAASKAQAARSVLAARGLELAEEPLTGDWSERWGRQAALQLMRGGAGIDGIVCGNDLLARGVIEALRDLGVRVPQEVGVIGFDNWGVMVEGSRPQITSLDLELPEVGRAAARRLMTLMAGGTEIAGAEVIDSRLVPRESTELDVP